jgi:hypothetical protein
VDRSVVRFQGEALRAPAITLGNLHTMEQSSRRP